MKATYIKTQLQSIVNVSRIVTVHEFEYDRNFVFLGEKHDFWEMVYVDKGCVRIKRDEEEITLSQGGIVFHEPNEFHSIRAEDSAPNFVVITFVCNSPSMMYLKKYTTSISKTLRGFVSAIMAEAENVYGVAKNTPNLKKLNKKPNATIGGEQMIKTYLEQLLILLIRGITERGDSNIFPSKESMESHLVTATKNYIENHLEEEIRINEICHSIGYSKSYLSRLFREQTGNTIAHYAVGRKIKAAKQLIREGDMNFAEISDRLAFDNPQYFSSVFKRYMGMTPTEFKDSLSYKK